jgi:hypothetical protein
MSDNEYGDILAEWDGAEADDTPSTTTAEPEAPAGDESTASSHDDSDTETESGQPRDDKGRFAEKAATETTQPAATEAPAALAADPTDAHAPTEQPDTPFAFRSLGQEVPIEGAVRRADGSLVIPAASLPTVQQLFARGHEFQTRGMAERSQLQQQIKHLEEQATLPTLNERKYETAFKVVAEILDNPELLAQIALDPDRRALYLERMQNAVDRVTLEHERTQRDRSTKVEDSTQRESVETNAVSSSLEAIAGLPDHAGLTAEDKEHLGEWVKDMRGALIREATSDDAAQWGVKVGERVVDNARIMKYVAHIAAMRKAQASTVTKAQEAARFNKAQQPKPPVPVKPKPQSVKVETVPPKKKTGKQQFDETFREWGKSPDLSFGDDED